MKTPIKTKRTTKPRTKTQKVTLYTYSFCTSNLGVWDRAWFLTKAEAQAAFEVRALEMGKNPKKLSVDDQELSGVSPVEVPLTARGLFDFANNYAVDTGAC